MKTVPGDPAFPCSDDDDCIEAELDIAAYVASGSLEDAPARLFLHLLECPPCLQTALACMKGPNDADRLLQRLHQERKALGSRWSECRALRGMH